MQLLCSYFVVSFFSFRHLGNSISGIEINLQSVCVLYLIGQALSSNYVNRPTFLVVNRKSSYVEMQINKGDKRTALRQRVMPFKVYVIYSLRYFGTKPTMELFLE